jgi:hypothetical protein
VSNNEDKKRDGIILESMTGSQQVAAKVTELARDKPWLVAGLLLLALPTVFFAGKTYLGVKEAEKGKVDTEINISGGDPADESGSRNPDVDSLRGAIKAFPPEKKIKVSQYEFGGEVLTFDLAASPGIILQEGVEADPSQVEAHRGGKCHLAGATSSCPIVDDSGKLSAFVQVDGTEQDVKAFLDAAAVTNAQIIKKITGDSQ